MMLLLTAAGLVMGACFAGMAALGDLLGHLLGFLWLFGIAGLAYGVAVWIVLRRSLGRWVLPLIVGLAVVFRVALLFTTPPTLSSDVYRYIWDGRLANLGVNPYAHAVESPLLDPFDSPLRSLVHHSWMATPYLPAAQAFFALVTKMAPESELAFQVATVVLDLLTGGLVLDLLRRLKLPQTWGLIYLWHPLVVVEFAHSAHVDALMICLLMAALWVLVALCSSSISTLASLSRSLSVIALAAATLTKGLPALLVPILWRRWGWWYVILFGGLVVVACFPFALGAGWGLAGPLDGEGVFGALRIYSARWNYNSGLYHWLEVTLSGYRTPGAVPPELVGWGPIWTAKLIVAAALFSVMIGVWVRCLRHRNCEDDLGMLRLAVLVLTAYLLLATTVHPWYVTLILPLLPFLPAGAGDPGRSGRYLLPLLVFSLTVALSYLTYLDPENLREYGLVRFLEYVPLYLLLIWAAWPASGGAGAPEAT
jgi:hypothetical protein